MKKIKDRLDRLMDDPVAIIREFLPNGDPGSSIPLEWQVIGHYSVTDKGVFSFENDADANFDCVPVYPAPFVCWLTKEDRIVVHFILENRTIEEEGSLDNFIEKYFHSLTPRQKLKVCAFASTCILKNIKPLGKGRVANDTSKESSNKRVLQN